VTGSVTTVELLKSFASILAHPDYRPGMKSLTDMREVAHFATSGDIRQIVHFMEGCQDQISGGRAALVVSTDVSFGMARMLQIMSQHLPIEICVFRDLEEACTWLDIQAPENLGSPFTPTTSIC